MKNSNIAESVFNVNLKYSQMQNLTEELFFRCLEDNLGIEYFNEQIEKIWGDVDHTFMAEEIANYSEIIYERDMAGKEIEAEPKKIINPLFALVPISVIAKVENQFKNDKKREYKRSYESPVYKKDKDEYIKMKLAKYTNDTVPYKIHKYEDGQKTDQVIGYRFVSPSVYNSMIHNTNLVREGWNRTVDDADKLGINKFYIPYHSFSCPHCISHQEKKMSKNEITKLAGRANTAQGNILHPNCKCEIVMWEKGDRIRKSKLSKTEKEEIYEIRQKVNGLTLKKERIKTEMNIAKHGGYEDLYDEYNQQRNKINKEIRQLKEALPTTELKKQVVAINRL